MEINLRRADIVIAASAHNPSIVSPQWLKEMNLIVEEPKHFVNTPDFSLFDSETILLVVDRQRLQITAKKHDEESLKSFASIGSGYIRLLSHIPYSALGLNFVWHVKTEEEGEELPTIRTNIGSIHDFSSILVNHELNFGSIIYARKEPYLLKISIESQGRAIFICNFNYHHEVTKLDTDKI